MACGSYALKQPKTGYMLLFGFAAGLPYALVLGTLYAWLSDAGDIDLETMGVFLADRACLRLQISLVAGAGPG